MNKKFQERATGITQLATHRLALHKLGADMASLALLAFVLLIPGSGTKAQSSLPANAAALFGNVGGTFVMTPADNSGLRFNVVADTVGQASILGNFTDHAQLVVQFTSATSAILTGGGTWTTADGQSTVTLTVTGTATPDPANPYIFNNNYQATITGGTGAFAGATGSATVSEVVKFNSTLTGGLAGLSFKGYVLTPSSGN